MAIEKLVKYENLPVDFKKKVLLKYMGDKKHSLIQIKNGDSNCNAIEVWHNDFYYLVFVDERTLGLIDWDIYKEMGQDKDFDSFFLRENTDIFNK
tara:strand:+ start:251 stop:535 length:285 start_codon:yes stop_codon:yes gene_type:complete